MPMGNNIRYLVNDFTTASDTSLFSDSQEILTGEVILFSIQRELVLTSPTASRLVGITQVVGGREGPSSLFVHKEREILGVVIVVSGHNVKHHSAEQLNRGLHRHIHSSYNGEDFFV